MHITKEQHEELKEKVMEHWANAGVRYLEYYPDELHGIVSEDAQNILDDPFECVTILGFESIEEYLASAERES